MARRKKSPTWPVALDLFEDHLRAKNASPLTRQAYLRAVRLVQEKTERRSPAAVTLGELRSLLAGLLAGTTSRSGRPLSPGAACRDVAAWRAFFGLLAEESLCRADPTARLRSPRAQRRAPQHVLTVAEVRRLLGAADLARPTGLRDRAVAEVLYAAGLRRAEVCALDLTDLDHDERELVVRRGKGDKARLVPLARSAYEQVQRYLEHARPQLAAARPDKRGRRQTEGRPKDGLALFLTRFGSRLDAQTVRRLLHTLAERAGIKKAVTPHTLRRSFGTHLLKGGASPRHLQLLLGHSSLDTTALYLRLDAQDLRREILLRHPRERFC